MARGGRAARYAFSWAFEERRAVASAHFDVDLTALAIQESKKYLNQLIHTRIAKQAASAQVAVTSSIEVCDDIADSLIQVAEGKSRTGGEPYTAMALTTHGRGGVQRWLMGSITERVLQSTKLPLLVVHLEKVK